MRAEEPGSQRVADLAGLHRARALGGRGRGRGGPVRGPGARLRRRDRRSGGPRALRGGPRDPVMDSSVLAAIGSTPLVRLRKLAPENGAELWVKLEYLNPTGSMKDRMALSMIEGAERDGLIGPGTTIVEHTGGSTGPALALVCRAKGHALKIVLADCRTEERLQLMETLGAELEVIPSVEGRGKVTAQDIQNMVDRAAELAQEPG